MMNFHETLLIYKVKISRSISDFMSDTSYLLMVI